MPIPPASSAAPARARPCPCRSGAGAGGATNADRPREGRVGKWTSANLRVLPKTWRGHLALAPAASAALCVAARAADARARRPRHGRIFGRPLIYERKLVALQQHLRVLL